MKAYIRPNEQLKEIILPEEMKDSGFFWDAVFPWEAKEWLEKRYGLRLRSENNDLVWPMISKSHVRPIVLAWNNKI